MCICSLLAALSCLSPEQPCVGSHAYTSTRLAFRLEGLGGDSERRRRSFHYALCMLENLPHLRRIFVYIFPGPPS